MPYIAAVFLFLLPLCSSWADNSSNNPEAPLITIASVVDNPLTKVGIQFMRQVYSMAGYQTRFTSLSAARSKQLLEIGDIDAELFRAEGLDDIASTMAKVPEALIEVKISAYAVNPKIQRLSSTAFQSYRVGIRHGLNIQDQLKLSKTSQVYRLEQLVNMLKYDRIDIVILSETSAFFLRQKFGLRDLRALEPHLATLPVYHYVHRRHAHLIEQLADNIKILKNKGVAEKMINDFMQNAENSSEQQ